MGSRFRKSVKITKGTKVNFSKSGASLSLGGRGHSVNFSSRGTKSTIGLPGSGLSYSTNITSHGSSGSSRSSSSTRSTVQLPREVQIRMNDRGQIVIQDGNGIEITDKAVLRKIKSMPQFQSQIARLEEMRLDKIDSLVQEAEAENERFLNIHKLAPVVDSISDFEARYAGLMPEKYIIRRFDVSEPTKDKIRETLTKEAEEVVKGFFMVGKARKQYVEEHFQARYDQAISDWEEEKKAYYAQQEEVKSFFDRDAAAKCEKQKEFLRSVIDGDEEAICEVFDSWLASCELPIEMNVDYEWNPAEGSMYLDVDLPEIEDLPSTKLVKTESGKLKDKKKTQTELRGEYARLVFGLAVFITANAFNVSPVVKKILISGYTQRENKDGILNDDYIYSIRFTRNMFEGVNFSEVSPRDFCLQVDHRCNMTSTSLFRKIEPFEDFN